MTGVPALVALVALGLLAAILLIPGIQANHARFRTFTGQAMATDWEVTIPAGPAAEPLAHELIALFGRLDGELSEWQEGSPLSAVNRAAGIAPVEVPAELFSLVATSIELGRATDGAFDPSWAALWGVWDFRSPGGSPRLPHPGVISEHRALVDFRRIVLDPGRRSIFLPTAGMKIGLGAIGKGYALERAVERLEGRELHDFLLSGGGQIVARGRRGERPWRVGLRDPRGAPDDLFARIEIADASLATSADNEAFFEIDGNRYHHILDPRTGWPATGTRSATVLHADATLADGLSTALLVLGSERGFAVVRQLGGEALIIDERGELRMTPGFERHLELLHPPHRD